MSNLDRLMLLTLLSAKFIEEFGLARCWALPAQEYSDMSIRILAQRLVQNGRILIRSLKYNEHYSPRITNNHTNKIHVIPIGKPLSPSPQGSNNVTNSTTISYIGAQARRLFVNNILNRVTNSLAGELRKKATNRLLIGDSTPFFALVGVSLASGTGILTKDEELEGVCWEIRDAIAKLQWTKPHNDKNYETTNINNGSINGLKDFIIGPAIAKGCSAVVYAARMKKPFDNDNSDGPIVASDEETLSKFPLAIKMMFNYDAESNALTILRAMYRETVPTRQYHQIEELADWEQRMANNKRILPPHPNIVAMYHVFADKVPCLPGSSRLYPDALPARINPDGSGRNMSLFLLMKRIN
ncbi:hypothetical protein PV326_002480 [Microctonus aethiopoides]|nr:hypothetical protein PV326_002480 [Microctonus aethiopoides]